MIAEPAAAGSATGRGSSAPQPVIEESQRSRATGGGNSAPEPAEGVETGVETVNVVYQTVFRCFNERMDVAVVKEARRAYAEHYHTPMAKVTKATWENPYHDLKRWITWANPGVTSDAPEIELPVVSKQECVARIHRVLSDRWTWLAANNLPHDVDMTNEQRAAFHKWALEEFAKEPDEQERSRDRRAVRARFNLEKQRRAGSPQMWDLLSYKGRVTETDVRSLADVCKKREPTSDSVIRSRSGEPRKRRTRFGAPCRCRDAWSRRRCT